MVTKSDCNQAKQTMNNALDNKKSIMTSELWILKRYPYDKDIMSDKEKFEMISIVNSLNNTKKEIENSGKKEFNTFIKSNKCTMIMGSAWTSKTIKNVADKMGEHVKREKEITRGIKYILEDIKEN